MAIYKIVNYILRYDLVKNQPWIIFQYRVKKSLKFKNWYPPKEDAIFLADFLRKEKPLYYVDTETNK
jgi:hypothetical protein